MRIYINKYKVKACLNKMRNNLKKSCFRLHSVDNINNNLYLQLNDRLKYKI